MPKYVDNEQFLELLFDYIQSRDARKLAGLPPPHIPDAIGRIFIQMAKRLSTRYNFNGYTFKDEMVNDGILNAVEAINSFNPEKSRNPFAYFTQIMFWAFVRRIEIEKKLRNLKEDLASSLSIETFSVQENDGFNLNRNNMHFNRGQNFK